MALFKPQLISGIPGDTVVQAHYVLPFATVTSAHYFGAAALPQPQAGSNIPAGLTVNGSTIQFPLSCQGTWNIAYYARGASTALTNSFSFTQGSDIADNNVFVNSTTATDKVLAGLTADCNNFNKSIAFTTTTTLANRTFVISAGTLPGTLNAVDLFIWQGNANLVS